MRLVWPQVVPGSSCQLGWPRSSLVTGWGGRTCTVHVGGILGINGLDLFDNGVRDVTMKQTDVTQCLIPLSLVMDTNCSFPIRFPPLDRYWVDLNPACFGYCDRRRVVAAAVHVHVNHLAGHLFLEPVRQPWTDYLAYLQALFSALAIR